MTDEEFKNLRTLVARLKEKGDENDVRAYLVVAREMVLLLSIYDKNDLVSLLMPLLPWKHRSAVQAMAQEIRASARIKKIKDAESDCRGGVKVIQSALFRTENASLKPKVKMEPESTEAEERRREKEAGLIQAEHVVQLAKKRVAEVIERSRSHIDTRSDAAQRGEKLAGILKTSTQNNASASYHISSKRAKVGAGKLTQIHNVACTKVSSTHSVVSVPVESDKVDKCLMLASSESFLTDSGNARRIKSNTPKGEGCTICETPMKEPMMAPCHHYACKKCWYHWLRRPQGNTCPVCREPTEKSKLSQVVFEKEAGAGVPTLSQICLNEFSSENDSCDDD